jgi:hypothetical protein
MRKIIVIAQMLVKGTIVVGATVGIATAEVMDADKHGFTLVQESVVDATRAEAWIAAVENIDQWWNADHTISGNASLLSIDARPLGCFCEATGAAVKQTFGPPGHWMSLHFPMPVMAVETVSLLARRKL